MMERATIAGLCFVFLSTAAHLLFALAKGRALLAGRFIERSRTPVTYWLWLAFDFVVLAFCGALLIKLIGEGVS